MYATQFLVNCIAQLLVEGGSLLEVDDVVLVLVRAGDSNGLSLDLGVEPNELARVAFNGARMGGDLGRVLVVDDAQLERVSVVLANVVFVGSSSSSVRVHWLAMRGHGYVWCFVEWLLDGCGKWNSY